MEDLIDSFALLMPDKESLGEKFKREFCDSLFTKNPKTVSPFKVIAGFLPKEKVNEIPLDMREEALGNAFINALPEDERDNFKFIIYNSIINTNLVKIKEGELKILKNEIEITSIALREIQNKLFSVFRDSCSTIQNDDTCLDKREEDLDPLPEE